MRFLSFRSWALLTPLAFVVGCSSITELLDTRTVGIEATPTALVFGQSSVIKWVGPKADRINSSNFGLTSTQLNGEITDFPPITTVYTINGNNSEDGHDVIVSIAVTVDESAKRVLLIGDSATPEVPQVQSLLEGITSQAVTVSLAMPADLTPFDCIVIHATGNIGTVDANKVRDFMATGKGVVILGMACRKLASGNTTTTSVAAIGSWFGGATSTGTFYDSGLIGWDVQNQLDLVPISAVSRNFDELDQSGRSSFSCYVHDPGSQCDLIIVKSTTSDAWGYKPTTGGRLFFTGSADGGATNIELPAIFLSGTMWCLEGV